MEAPTLEMPRCRNGIVPGNGAPVSRIDNRHQRSDSAVKDCEKSPDRSSAVGRLKLAESEDASS